MWRAFFLAIGVYCCILGGECLLIDKAVLAARQDTAASFVRGDDAGRRRELVPSEWAPWSLLSVGAVTILYSFTIPKRVKE
jgi:hypothetical protein